MFCTLLVMTVLSLVFLAQSAVAHEPPVILPMQLDFDASHAPKNCKDRDGFRTMLGAWVDPTLLRDDAERRLVVRIRWYSTGGKQAHVSLVDAQGVTVVEQLDEYPPKVECHKVLWKVAHNAAKILGAFEPPPPKEPAFCPASTPCPSCPAPRACPTYSLPAPPTPTITLSPTPTRSFLGIGAFVGSGIHSEIGFGPYLLLGFVPSRRLSHLQFEFEAAWTSQTLQSSTRYESMRMFSMPLVGSLCFVRGVVRFCGGLATTIFYANSLSDHDELHLMFGGSFRVGTELFVHGPLSIRTDVFGRIALAHRRFGTTAMGLDDPTAFAAGLAVIGAWLFD